MTITPTMASRIETWPLDQLHPYARNAKTHDADQVARIAASMSSAGPCATSWPRTAN